jgi:ribosomal protein S18 acetylase RimI-like enzyme
MALEALQAVTLTPFGSDDLEFLYEVYARSRDEELVVVPWSAEQKEAFLRFQFHAQHTHYQKHFPHARFDVIHENGLPVGRLYVERAEETLTVIDIALLPRYRGRGIGSALIRQLLAEAQATGKRVQLHVEQFNPALRLYERLGFRQIGDHGVYYQMEWTHSDAHA